MPKLRPPDWVCSAAWAGEKCDERTAGDMCRKHTVRQRLWGNPYLVNVGKGEPFDIKEDSELFQRGRRRCRICRLNKLLSSFNKTKTSSGGYARRCKKCWVTTSAERSRRNGYLVREYGITLEDYEALLALQGGVCAICGGGTTRRYLAVDHDHRTGQVRGLLCGRCNSGLAQFMDRVSNLEAAVRYRKAPPYGRLLDQREKERTQMTIDQALANSPTTELG